MESGGRKPPQFRQLCCLKLLPFLQGLASLLPSRSVSFCLQATGYGLLVSLLAGNRSDFDRLLTFHRHFLLPSGLMYWQLLRRDGKVGFRV